MQHIAAQCTILSTSATSAHSYARASSIDSSSGQIIGGGRAGAGPATKHASCRTRLIRGPTIQQRGELLAEERPSSQGGLQPQNRAQRPLHRRRQFGIRGHGHDNMDLRTCANTGLTKKGLLLQHSSFVWPKHQHHARPEMQKWCRWLLQSHDSERRNVTSAAGSLATQPQPQL